MIYARLKIAPSLENVENASLRPNTEQALPVRGRLSVLDESIKQQVFDTVRLTLRGMDLARYQIVDMIATDFYGQA